MIQPLIKTWKYVNRFKIGKIFEKFSRFYFEENLSLLHNIVGELTGGGDGGGGPGREEAHYFLFVVAFS